MENEGFNRRRHTRYGRAYRITYATAERPDQWMTGVSLDVSSGGLGLNVGEFIPSTGKLSILIHMSFWGQPIRATGRVVWQDYHMGIHSRKRAGLEFTEIDEAKLRHLLEGVAR